MFGGGLKKKSAASTQMVSMSGKVNYAELTTQGQKSQLIEKLINFYTYKLWYLEDFNFSLKL